MSKRLLIIDDDPELCEMLADYLGGEGFEVAASHDGESGSKRALANHWDAILLDVMMPRMNGLDALRRIRGGSQAPVIMLTARGEDIDRIVGLELGADDYLPKPFNPRELVARLRAVLRRTREAGAGEPTLFAQGRLAVDAASREARVDGQAIDLTSTEFSLLLVLTRAPGQVVTKEQLSREALGRELARHDRGIDMHISNLRRKLKTALGMEPPIVTVRGLGYQLVPGT